IAISSRPRATRDSGATADQILLAHAIDIDVDRRSELSAAAQRRFMARINLELHSRNRVRELEEVAGNLRQYGDVMEGDELVHLRRVHLGGRPRSGDDDRPARRRRDRNCRVEVLYLLRRDGNDDVGSLAAGRDMVSPGLKAYDDIGAV